MVLETVLFYKTVIAAPDLRMILIARDQKINVPAREAVIAPRREPRRDNFSALVDIVCLIQVCPGITERKAIQVDHWAPIFPKEGSCRLNLTDG
jgi:hypothetical protein